MKRPCYDRADLPLHGSRRILRPVRAPKSAPAAHTLLYTRRRSPKDLHSPGRPPTRRMPGLGSGCPTALIPCRRRREDRIAEADTLVFRVMLREEPSV